MIKVFKKYSHFFAQPVYKDSDERNQSNKIKKV